MLSLDKGAGCHFFVSYKGESLSDFIINHLEHHQIWRVKKAGFRESRHNELFENPNNRRWEPH